MTTPSHRTARRWAFWESMAGTHLNDRGLGSDGHPLAVAIGKHIHPDIFPAGIFSFEGALLGSAGVPTPDPVPFSREEVRFLLFLPTASSSPPRASPMM
jgi:hypothetical protein